tara:strand:+ start:5224 stop:6129 length:906 start_codon:yes stop_codon:yes gene_type:complete
MANQLTDQCRNDGTSASRANDATQLSESHFITFDVVVNDAVDAINSSSYSIGMNHPNYTSMKLEGINATPHSGTEWFFEITWTDNQTRSSSSATPAQFKALIDYGSWSYQRVVEVDKSNPLKIIQNSAGEKFDPPPLETITYPTISVTVRENTPNINFIEDVGSINSVAIDIVGVTIPLYCGMLADYKISPVTDPVTGVVRYNNTFTFQLNFNKDQSNSAVTIGFQSQIANVGLNELLSGEAKTQQILDNNQEPVNTPQFLTGGALANKGEVSRSANYLTYVINDLVDFSTFGLPTTYPSY